MTQMPTYDESPYDPYSLPLSKMAVAAFVIAFLLGPLGIVLAIFGIMYTGPGVARGRGFAIAAIPIGLLNLLLVSCAGAVYWAFPVWTNQQAIIYVLEGPVEEVDQRAATSYARLSVALTGNVTEREFADWARSVIQEFGSLPDNPNLGQPTTTRSSSGSLIFVQSFPAPFPDAQPGMTIDFLIGPLEWREVVMNAAVGDTWLNPDTAPPVAAPSGDSDDSSSESADEAPDEESTEPKES